MLSKIAIIILLVSGIGFIASGLIVLRRKCRKQDDLSSSLYSFTHEKISNPLQSTMAALANLERGMDDGVAIRRDVQALKKALIKLVNVTHNIRALALLDMSNKYRPLSTVNIVSILQKIIMEAGELAELSGVAMSYEGVDQCLATFGNESDISRLFFNLIDNGIRHSQGVPDARVRVVITQSTYSITVCICDNGIGMSNSRMKTLGISANRLTSKSTYTPGNGLGFHLVSKIVARCGYRINITSKIKRGTTVCVTIPSNPSGSHLP